MRIFQTFILPEELIAKNKLSYAAVNFSKNLISGDVFDKVYSLVPTSVKGNLGLIVDDAYELIYSKWRRKRTFLSTFSIFWEQWELFKKINKNDSLWTYNLNIMNGFLFLLLKFFKPSVKRNIILLDFTPANKWYQQNAFFIKMINDADGIICLSKSELLQVKNIDELPGVVPANGNESPLIKNLSPDFLISGMLGENISMLKSLLIPAFKQMPQYRLHISGMAPDEDEVKTLIKNIPNIYYYKKLTLNEYFELLHSIPFLLSTRNPDYPENKCNFPSKIIEGLLHNRIIISTLHYSQLRDVNYLEVSSNIDQFIIELQNIMSYSQNELMEFANQGAKVHKLFSPKIWNDTMTNIENRE